ncbi:MAG: hypothetical protein QOF51_2453 [Chloroflexota bacterium]|jgi:hypothetical protein|nr:hypothetical protein [Chloroflexota bacterium]
MASNDYHFITRWRVHGTIDEIAEILGDAPSLARWWPSVYLDVEELVPPSEPSGVGRVVDLYTKGWLPYTLRWQFRVTEANFPHGFSIEAWGDFDGRGIWTLEQDGGWANVTYDWKIRAEKPLLRYFSFVMKPIFAANHRWAMAQGEESLRLELARRHTLTEEGKTRIPAPPGPTRVPRAAVGAVAGAVVGLFMLLRLAAKRR